MLIALSLGAGIYYTQAPPSNGQSTTTVTKVAGYTFTDTGGVACAGYPSINSSSSSPKAVPVPGAEVTPTPIAAWRYVPGGNNTADIQVAVISLLPGVVGHLCVAYPVGKIVGGAPGNPNVVSFNPVVYNASGFTGDSVPQSIFSISAQPNLVTFPQSTAGFLFVDYTFSSNTTGFYYYSLPWAESCRDLPLSVNSSLSPNFSRANFDQLLNISAPAKSTFDIPGTGNCPGLPPPLGGGAIVAFYNLSLGYITEETGVQASTSGSESASVTSSYTITSLQIVNATTTSSG